MQRLDSTVGRTRSGPYTITDGVDAPTRDVLARWASVLERLGTDRDACARDVEWVAKLPWCNGNVGTLNTATLNANFTARTVDISVNLTNNGTFNGVTSTIVMNSGYIGSI